MFLKRKGESFFQKLDKSGQIRQPRLEKKGLVWSCEFRGKKSTPLGANYTFEFADILAFETDYNKEGDVVLTRTWNANLGNGNATVNSRPGPAGEFEVGDWFILFYRGRNVMNFAMLRANRSIIRMQSQSVVR